MIDGVMIGVCAGGGGQGGSGTVWIVVTVIVFNRGGIVPLG